MPRKRKTTTQEEPPADTTSSTTSTAVAEPQLGIIEPPAGIPEQASERTENRPSFAERVGQRKGPIQPDPFGIAGDYLAGVRLFESRRDHQMALKFNEKPSQAVIDKLKEAGYRWNPADMIWAQPVWPATAMSTRIKAERLYQEVRQMIRAEKGMEDSPEIPF
ncbi:MAG TPA: hypothetical protein VHC22_19235 [Pirellulales bacterium]|nr:hypothetical protein [Pirellulales bacterium]